MNVQIQMQRRHLKRLIKFNCIIILKARMLYNTKNLVFREFKIGKTISLCRSYMIKASNLIVAYQEHHRVFKDREQKKRTK